MCVYNAMCRLYKAQGIIHRTIHCLDTASPCKRKSEAGKRNAESYLEGAKKEASSERRICSKIKSNMSAG